MTKERQEQFPLFRERIALSITKNEQIIQKTDEGISNPAHSSENDEEIICE